MSHAVTANRVSPPRRGTFEKFKRHAELLKWTLRGKPVPPPHSVKVQVISQAARNFNCKTLVETGTYLGDMVVRTRHLFDRVYTIEVDQWLHAGATVRFQHDPGVSVLLGDSAHILPSILDLLTGPTVFWLDGHYSGGNTGRGERETPIQAEVELIFRHAHQGHAILVDDARLFNGTGDYPTLCDFRAQLMNLNSSYAFSVANDIIQFVPKSPALR